MELTRTDAVFSRIAMMLFYVQKKIFSELPETPRNILEKIKKILAKDEDQGGHTLLTRVGHPLMKLCT